MPIKPAKRSGPDPHRALRDHLIELLRGGHAHLIFKDAVAGWPASLHGAKPPGQPFTGWRLVEHIRISQWDIVEFSRNPKYKSPKWPLGYWPKEDAPADTAAWDASVAQVERDRQDMERLVLDPTTDFFAKIPHGTGQTILREAMLVADHTSYHVGQLVLLRRLLGIYEG